MMNLHATDRQAARLALRLIGAAQLFLVTWAVMQAVIAPALAGFPYSPAILALTHLLSLGWATLTCLGALAQLLPVLLQRELRWPALLRRGTWPLVAGVTIFSCAFVDGSTLGLAAGAALLSGGLIALLACFGATLAAARPWDATGRGIALALAALAAQLAVGVLLVLNRLLGIWPGLGLNGAAGHALLGLLGWLSVLTVALSYRLLPLFTLAHGYRCRFQGLAPAGLAAAGAGALLGLWLQAPGWLLALWAIVATGSALLWLLDVRAIVRRRVRRRLELPIILFGASGAILALLGGLAVAGGLDALALAPPKLLQLLFMGGMEAWVGLAMMAMLHKIIPFLIWIVRAGSGAGAVPAIARDLFAPQLSALSLGGYLAGALLAMAGVAASLSDLIRAGSALLALSGLGLLANTGRAWRYRPAGTQVPGRALAG